jgi:dihydroxy-acid dehydratase
MREMALFRWVLMATGFHDSVYLVTDGRFSGYTSGPCIGYLSPEAADGGPIALIRNGGMVSIDINHRALNVNLSEDELRGRLKEWKTPAPRIVKGYLARYSKAAGSAAEGAILRG